MISGGGNKKAGRVFREGDLVLVRVPGHPARPARVHKVVRHNYRVFLFDTHFKWCKVRGG